MIEVAQWLGQMPGPEISIDFSKGDWWIALLFYLLMTWLKQRGNGGGQSR